jgi:hypothetical protein
MATASILANRRQKNLVILGGVTLLMVLLAVVAVYQRAAALAPQFEPRALFPGIAGQLSGLSEIEVTNKTGTLHIRPMDGRWVVVERDNYPADPQQIRLAGEGLRDLQVIEAKTSRADWLNYLGLGAPPQGDATQMKLTAGSTVLADVLIGQSQGTPDALGRTSMYVRKPNENQSWLARGYLVPKAGAQDWLDKTAVVIPRDRVKGAVVDPADGPSYTLSRDNKEAMDFKMVDLPRGRELSFEGSPDGVAGAIVGFVYQDVAKADTINFMNAPSSVFNTFDGLNITVRVATKGMERWAMISADATNPMVQGEADMINARNNGWAYRIDEMKANQIVATRETLLRPMGGG